MSLFDSIRRFFLRPPNRHHMFELAYREPRYVGGRWQWMYWSVCEDEGCDEARVRWEAVTNDEIWSALRR